MNRRTAKKIAAAVLHQHSSAYSDTQLKQALSVARRWILLVDKRAGRRVYTHQSALIAITLKSALTRRATGRIVRKFGKAATKVSEAFQEFGKTVLGTIDKIGALGVAMKQMGPVTRVEP